MPRNIESNAYTIGFAIVIVVGVAVMLSGFSVLLKEKYESNVILDKKFQILGAVDKTANKSTANAEFDSKVQSYIVNSKGEKKEVPPAEALNIEIRKELKKDPSDRNVPLYVYKGTDGEKYILTLHGNGLWDFIYGFMALSDDWNTVSGVKFDHVGETPGLGAEITKDWFQNNFIDEQIFNKSGEYVGIKVLKGKGNKANAEMHKVDGMSGATITGDGVEAMIDVSVENYLPFIKKAKGA